MGPDGKGTAQAAVYIDGQPVQYTGEITLPEQTERQAPPAPCVAGPYGGASQ